MYVTWIWTTMKTTRRDGDPGGLRSNHIPEILAAVEDTPDLHRIADHYIEDGEVPDLDAVVGILPLFYGSVRLERLRAVQALPYGGFNVIHQALGGRGVLELERDIVYDLVQVLLEEGEDTQLITLSFHGYAPSHG